MAQRLILMGEWGFPLTSRNLCYLIKAYLDGQGRTTRFVDNKPGPDFVKGYLKRHPRLAVRTANLIKRSRAELSKKIVDDFFDRYERVAAGIPKTHVFNCDETNLREHQGNHKALFRRGVKYAELVRDHTKNSTSVMFCGSAAGEMLPPYVVYKGANVYEAWSQRGPLELSTQQRHLAGSTSSPTRTGSRRCSCPMSDVCQAKNCSPVTICRHTSPWRSSHSTERTTLSMFACHQTARTRCSPSMSESLAP